jgi:hypothetical protein
VRRRSKTLAGSLAVVAVATMGAGCGGGGGASTTASSSTGAAGGESQLTADAKAKIAARTAETVMEAYATDHGGSYGGVTTTTLRKIEPTISPDSIQVTASGRSYKVAAPSSVGNNTFTVSRDASGKTSLTCEAKGQGGCPASGRW